MLVTVRQNRDTHAWSTVFLFGVRALYARPQLLQEVANFPHHSVGAVFVTTARKTFPQGNMGPTESLRAGTRYPVPQARRPDRGLG